MHLKIFFGERPLYLISVEDQQLTGLANDPGTLICKDPDIPAVEKTINLLYNSSIDSALLVEQDLKKLLEMVKSILTPIQAAGGLVQNDQREVLMIFRRGSWDLPKGKLDEGETLEECAIREVEEETGVSGLNLIAPLLITYHTYVQNKVLVLKESHWYSMNTNRQDLFAQTEEDIEQCLWVPETRISDYLPNCYPSIREVLKAGLDIAM